MSYTSAVVAPEHRVDSECPVCGDEVVTTRHFDAPTRTTLVRYSALCIDPEPGEPGVTVYYHD